MNKITLPWVGNNRAIIDKIKETNEWLDSKLEQLEVFKPKEVKQPTEESKNAEKKEDSKQGE